MTSRAPESFDAYVLSYAPPGGPVRPIGVFVFDHAENVLHWRLPEEWNFVADDVDREYLGLLGADVAIKVKEMGARELLAHLKDTLSNVLRLSEAFHAEGPDAVTALDRAYDECVRINA